MRVSGGGGLPGRVECGALDLAPLHTELLNVLARGALPPELRGGLTGRVVVRGGARGAVRIDTLVARYTDEAEPGSASRVTARGVLIAAGYNLFAEVYLSLFKL